MMNHCQMINNFLQKKKKNKYLKILSYKKNKAGFAI